MRVARREPASRELRACESHFASLQVRVCKSDCIVRVSASQCEPTKFSVSASQPTCQQLSELQVTDSQRAKIDMQTYNLQDTDWQLVEHRLNGQVDGQAKAMHISPPYIYKECHGKTDLQISLSLSYQKKDWWAGTLLV